WEKYAVRRQQKEDSSPMSVLRARFFDVSAISGESLRFCSSATTCCTPQLEDQLSKEIKAAFSESLRKDFGKAKTKMASRTAKFDEFFQGLISKSQTDFNDMFKKTYGIQYEQNTDLFSRMFDSLTNYYTQGGLNLAEKMNDFFVELYQKMFLVLNSQYSITEKYLNCVGGTMKDVQPFKEVPDKLIQQITRSFVATRVFVQALGVGRDVLAMLNERLEPSSACVQAVSKMHVCPQCSGFPDVKPCPIYCEAMVGECLADVVKINSLWSKFIDTMINLASRMEKQFNIEEVVEPIDLKISEAIMNFQESHEESIKMIYKQCGNPQFRSSSAGSMTSQSRSASLSGGLSRSERIRRSPSGSTWPSNRPRSSYSSHQEYVSRGGAGHTSTGGGGGGSSSGRSLGGSKKRKDNNGLEKHIEAIKKQLQNIRPFFSQLPQRLCAAANKDYSPTAPESADLTVMALRLDPLLLSDAECWNGSEKTRNLNSTSSDSSVGGRLRPSRPSKAQRGLVARQQDLLRIIIKKLQLAYDGKSIEWGGVEEDSGSQATLRSDDGSGDVEGSGAGYSYGGSGDERHPDDPDLEGGDDAEDIVRPSHPPPASQTTTEVTSTSEDLYFASSTVVSVAGAGRGHGSTPKPGTRRRKKKKNGSQKVVAEGSAAAATWHQQALAVASLCVALTLTHTLVAAR
ncbi:glypican-4-like, partial [Tropilaelaps mercedesae]